MPATQPVLQGITLPWPRNPSGYRELLGIRAVSAMRANGNLAFQQLNDSAKGEFALSWVMLTNDEYLEVLSAYDLLLNSPASGNFTSPAGVVYTVTPAEGNPPLNGELIIGGTNSTLWWNVEMRLRQATTG